MTFRDRDSGQRHAQSTLRLQVIDSANSLLGLKDAWNGLLRSSGSDMVFLSWEWVRAWWAAYGEERRLNIVTAWDDDTLVGVAPFYKERVRRGSLRLSTLALLGDGSSDSDYLDLFCAPGQEARVATALMSHLMEQSWDLLRIYEIPQDSPNLPWIMAQVRTRYRWRRQVVPCSYVPLPASWEEYLRLLKPRMRTKLRSLRRKLEQEHRVELLQCQRESEVDAWLESLFELHARRWEIRHQGGVFRQPAKRKFYRDIAHQFLKNGWLRFYGLKVDDSLVAQQFCFEYGNRVFLLQEAFDPAWMEHGVGNVLRGYSLQDCIARGNEAYDFLGGVTQHKLSWGAVQTKSLRLQIANRTWRGTSWMFFRDVLGMARAAAKRWLQMVHHEGR